MGKHGIGECNSNGELLLALCSEFELIVTNTMFKQKDERKTTWMHPRSKHWHMIDFIIMSCRDKMDIHSTRAMRGANCWTNHQMLRSKVALKIRYNHNRQGTSKPTKLNTATLSIISHRESFEQGKDSALAQWEEKEHSTPDEEWAALQQVVYNTDRGCCKPGGLDPQRCLQPEMARAIAGLKDCKAPGGDGIPAEVRKHGGDNIFSRLHQVIIKVWEVCTVPQAWHDASIVTIYKKGDRTDCGKYRGISLLSIAGKIFARILLNIPSTHITPMVVP